MANDCGLLRQEDMPVFKQWLDFVGVGWNPGVGLWEVIRISYAGHSCVVTRNKQENYKSPEYLRPLIQCFRAYQLKDEAEVQAEAEITDTERLDFMLSKGRKVVTELTGWSSENTCYDIYVTEGSMEDRKYTAVSHDHVGHMKASTDIARKLKREAIDLAITESKEQTNEKSN